MSLFSLSCWSDELYSTFHRSGRLFIVVFAISLSLYVCVKTAAVPQVNFNTVEAQGTSQDNEHVEYHLLFGFWCCCHSMKSGEFLLFLLKNEEWSDSLSYDSTLKGWFKANAVHTKCLFNFPCVFQCMFSVVRWHDGGVLGSSLPCSQDLF